MLITGDQRLAQRVFETIRHHLAGHIFSSALVALLLVGLQANSQAQSKAASAEAGLSTCRIPDKKTPPSPEDCPDSVVADAVSAAYLQGKAPVALDTIETLGTDLFGDKINLFNGSIAFEHVDISIPGNSALPVALARRYLPGQQTKTRGQFGEWDLSVPRIGGTFSGRGWLSQNGFNTRCSEFSLPPQELASAYGAGGIPDQLYTVVYLASDFHHGVTISVPNGGQRDVLIRQPGFALAPTDGASYPLVTKDLWQITCLPSLKNHIGEGFLAISPDGVRYRFDWMASQTLPFLQKQGTAIALRNVQLLATEVTDRFGNWVRYTYDSNDWNLLTNIQSSDGRQIVISNSGGRAVSATDGTRTFLYQYASTGFLEAVRQPDGSAWTFNLSGLTTENLSDMGVNADCDRPGTLPPDELIGTMTHPSGAVGSFRMRYTYHGRTFVDRVCKGHPFSAFATVGAVWPGLFGAQSLVEKIISGPGLAPMRWTYGSSTPFGWNPCAGCAERKQVQLNEPGDKRTIHEYGVRWRVNEGQLLRTYEGWTGSDWQRITDFSYRPASGQNYIEQFGQPTLRVNVPDWLASRNLPLEKKVVTQQGIQFTWQADPSSSGFDSLARPLKTSAYSGLGHIKTDLTQYADNYALWVLGQTASVVDGASGVEVLRHAYRLDTALKSASYSFGRFTNSFGYWGDGTLATLADAANRTTTFLDYKRGQPQLAVFADSSVASRVVNNLGNVDSVTNQVNTTHSFDHDAMGRVKTIYYPYDSDPGYYYPTQQRFEQVWADEWGLPAGHWRQTITTGNAVTTRWFDAMWRVRLQQTYDASNPSGTSSYVETRYDAAGRKSFESYPSRSFSSVGNALDGTAYEYDGLNRITRVHASSELGTLTTATDYLAGFQRRVTNPRGHATTFAFQAFDTPSEDIIAQIWAPENVNVLINRDVFGKPRYINRSGAGDGGFKTATRRYVYDEHQRLCKTIEPETGATIQRYDPAGNVQWRASGLTLTGDVCDWYYAPDSRKITFGYDPVNRLTSTTYGDGSPSITRRYWLDGKLKYSESAGWVWHYEYNNRRLLTQEGFTYGGELYPTKYHHDSHGNVRQMDYLGNISVDYAPNALGQASKAGIYASQVRWHPNGALAGYTLGNGIVHSNTQTVRGLPDQWSDSGVLSDKYWHDANGNVHYLEDWHQWSNTRGMTYDGLDRLKIANGPWGSGEFKYDTLDNIVYSTVGGRTLTHEFTDGTNRLTRLSGSQTIGIGYDANGNVSQRGAQTFNFDIGNRMKSAPGKSDLYVYDAEGRRSFIYYSDNTVGSASYGMDGKLQATGHNVKGTNWFIYLGGRQIAQPHMPPIPGAAVEISYIHTDALGSPVARTNSARQESNRTRYEPYGGTHSGGVPAGLEAGFTGHVNDAETGLVYMQQRYYEPLAGRFLSVDPVTTDDHTGAHFNRYVYGNNNPYKYTDPDGRAPVREDSGGGSVRFELGARNLDGSPVRFSIAESRANLQATREANGLSQNAASREAKREAGIPTSQQPTSQTNSRVTDAKTGEQVSVGRQQTYEVPKPGGGTENKSVQVSRDTQGAHKGMPQIEAGTVKLGGQTDAAGRPRIQNEGKVRVDIAPRERN
jgi:RHS repeat-associated protein